MKSPVSTYKSVFTFMLPRTSVQSGFTLIELMMVVLIIAVLAAIAIPSYRQYSVRNAESQAQAKMKQLQLELETWRATSLTYKGFVPKKLANDGRISYAYDNTNNTEDVVNTMVNVPDSPSPKYKIMLYSDMTGKTSLIPASNSKSFSTAGNSWRMIAMPQGNLKAYGANKIVLNSKGLSCKSTDDSFDENATCSEIGAKQW